MVALVEPLIPVQSQAQYCAKRFPGSGIKDLNQLRDRTGIVPQDVFLFSDTIENNIAFGYKNELPDKSVIEKAAK